MGRVNGQSRAYFGRGSDHPVGLGLPTRAARGRFGGHQVETDEWRHAAITLPSLDQSLWLGLLPAALLISLVGFVESVSVAQTLAAKRRQRIDPNQELIALGMANLGAGISGGSPVSGGFSRSVVNFEAGAATPLAGAFTALGIVLATLLLTDLLAFLPTATLRHDYRGSGDVD